MHYLVHIRDRGRKRVERFIYSDDPKRVAEAIIGEFDLKEDAIVRFAKVSFDYEEDEFIVMEYGFTVYNGKPFEVALLERG